MSDINPDRIAVAAPYRGQIPDGPAVSTFGGAVRAFFSNYITFSGRANRPEYWYAALFLVIISVAASIIDVLLFGLDSFSPTSSIISLGTFLPSLSATVRRFHDIDRTGWWVLLALIPILGWIVLIVFNCQKGTAGSNRFG